MKDNNRVDYWGYHLIMDCRSCDKDKITNKDVIIEFVKVLVKEIDMKAYGPTQIEHFATHNPDAAGFSFVQLIETSAITGHLVDKNGDAYLDIFSCKPFEIETAKSVVQKFFNPENIKTTFLHRQA